MQLWLSSPRSISTLPSSRGFTILIFLFLKKGNFSPCPVDSDTGHTAPLPWRLSQHPLKRDGLGQPLQFGLVSAAHFCGQNFQTEVPHDGHHKSGAWTWCHGAVAPQTEVPQRPPRPHAEVPKNCPRLQRCRANKCILMNSKGHLFRCQNTDKNC